jgi:uncharacterized protein RhaS with RHS repeats
VRHGANGKIGALCANYGDSALNSPSSRRNRTTYDGAFYITYDYDTLGRIMAIRENGAASGVGVLAVYGYDGLGRRSSVAYGNGTARNYAYDPVSRLAGLKIDLAGSVNDQVIGAYGGAGTAISYNPASQIGGIAKSNSACSYSLPLSPLVAS